MTASAIALVPPPAAEPAATATLKANLNRLRLLQQDIDALTADTKPIRAAILANLQTLGLTRYVSHDM